MKKLIAALIAGIFSMGVFAQPAPAGGPAPMGEQKQEMKKEMKKESKKEMKGEKKAKKPKKAKKADKAEGK